MFSALPLFAIFGEFVAWLLFFYSRMSKRRKLCKSNLNTRAIKHRCYSLFIMLKPRSTPSLKQKNSPGEDMQGGDTGIFDSFSRL